MYEPNKRDLKKMWDAWFSKENKVPPMREWEREQLLIKSGFKKKYDEGELFCGAGCGRKITSENIGAIVENEYKKGSWFVACTDPDCINQLSVFTK